MKNKKRMMVFIDNTNIFKRIEELNKTYLDGDKWPKSYDPLYLAKVLTGNRQLVKTYFYCAPPPDYLKKSINSKGKIIYWLQMSYYEEIKKLKNVELKYAYLTGPKDDLHEKNLDSQLTSNMQQLANEDAYDVAILIAGDGDYQSVIEAVKKIGKKVEIVYFRGCAPLSLIQLCDVARRIRKVFIKQLLFSYKESA